ncbi:2'-5' RNA ligase family protein [Flammeovirgaceae bacterium SG7u.111]|nr:2'-5' RNA ligase family protein [Flammeovirgaceae bacterium SG7u.132]WPO35301.1 2'-5' RNA ligase family protein [Flammeovirgaceae bacterium SG7u.111]
MQISLKFYNHYSFANAGAMPLARAYFYDLGLWILVHMKKIAIDIVLFPSEEIRDVAIELNRKLRENNPPKITLDTESVMPHISLTMGVLDEERLSEAAEILKNIAADFGAMELEIPEIAVKTSSSGKKMSSLQLADHPELQQLHNRLVQDYTFLLEKGASPEMFHSSPEVSESSLSWVDDYLGKHSGENFWPHITLGAGELAVNFAAKFTASRLALCHLGDHCTCREILVEEILKG